MASPLRGQGARGQHELELLKVQCVSGSSPFPPFEKHDVVDSRPAKWVCRLFGARKRGALWDPDAFWKHGWKGT